MYTATGPTLPMDLNEQAPMIYEFGRVPSRTTEDSLISYIYELEELLRERDAHIVSLERQMRLDQTRGSSLDFAEEDWIQMQLLRDDFSTELDYTAELDYSTELEGTPSDICSWFQRFTAAGLGMGGMELQLLLSQLQEENCSYASWSGPIHQRLAERLEEIKFSTKEWDLSFSLEEPEPPVPGEACAKEQVDLLNHIKAFFRSVMTGSDLGSDLGRESFTPGLGPWLGLADAWHSRVGDSVH